MINFKSPAWSSFWKILGRFCWLVEMIFTGTNEILQTLAAGSVLQHEDGRKKNQQHVSNNLGQ